MATKDTLFLDRDGVINVQLTNDYVKNTSELVLREDFLKALPLLTQSFKRFIITNQQGIAKGICLIKSKNSRLSHL
jgi:histidinol phosphatase-like enzyme